MSVRRLGEQGSRVTPLDAAVAEIAAEATPPTCAERYARSA